MCGVAAAIRPLGACLACKAPGIAILEQSHRGPHASGSIDMQLPWATISVSMNRLKIVDQSDIPVPFQYKYCGVVLALNGEIYNWSVLRQELGGPWETNCDAEVLARAYREWGIDGALARFNGMFSFILIDTYTFTIHVARDRFGQKPLCYAKHGEHLYLSSEAKGLPIKLAETACLDMDTLEYDVLEDMPLAGVKQLLPGHRLELTGLGDPKLVCWYEMPEVDECTNTEELLDELESLLLDSVFMRCDAEVPVALQFSGGLDSVLIHTACKRLGLDIPLYCVTMDEIDHITTARNAAPNDWVIPVEVNKAQFFEALHSVAFHLDTPATWTAVCQYLMNEVIARSERIVVSGEAADEQFSGYSRYRALYWLERSRHGMLSLAQSDPHLAGYQALINLVSTSEDPVAALLDRGGTSATGMRAKHWIAKYGGSGPSWRRLARTEFHTTMAVLLRMADKMASAWSLENRCPFLDYRIVELSTRVPESQLINERESKVLLRNLARRWNVPDVVVSEPIKRGLAVPWSMWGPTSNETARGAWDRSSFARIMRDHWRKSLLDTHHSCRKLSIDN